MRIISHFFVIFFVLFVGFSFDSFQATAKSPVQPRTGSPIMVASAETAATDSMNDAGPTNPTRTNRFSGTYSRPAAAGSPTGVVLPKPNPTSSPAAN